MNKAIACCIALGICLLAYLAHLAFPTSYDDRAGDSQRHTEREAEEFPLAVLAVAPTVPLLPTVTATPIATEATMEDVAVAATASAPVSAEAPALAPAATPATVAVIAPTAVAIGIDQTMSVAIASSDSLPEPCLVTGPPSSLGLDPFYTKYCSAHGLPIVSSAVVSDPALQRAWQTVIHMLDGMSQSVAVRNSIASFATRIGIIGVHQVTTDMPEHRNLYALFPSVDWNTRTRGVGATTQIPLLSIAEENLLCSADDLWIGKNILVHEFAHTIKNLGLDMVNPNVHTELLDVYQRALAAGRWANTYVASNVEEYWAEGVRLYFQIQMDGNAASGDLYPAHTRAELQSYDPELYQIIARVFDRPVDMPPCP
jgi:hypothetical protein